MSVMALRAEDALAHGLRCSDLENKIRIGNLGCGLRLLFIASAFPTNLKMDIHGVFQRMAVFLESFGGIAAEIDFLLFSHSHAVLDAGTLKAYREHLSGLAGMPVRLTIVSREEMNGTKFSKFRGWLRSVYNPLSSRAGEFCSFTGEAQLQAIRRSFANKPDLVFAFSVHSMAAILKAGVHPPSLVFDLNDVEHWKSLRGARWASTLRGKLSSLLSAAPLLAAERAAVKSASLSFVCSESDRRYMSALCGGSQIEVIPNPAPVIAPSSIPEARSLLFLGYYGYKPNAIAADYLIEEIWPRIRQRDAGCTLTIAGACPEAIRSYRSAPEGVRFTGFVEDLDVLYNDARVVCCPIRIAGGTRIKIVEAAARARPVVSTSVGAEGLNFLDGSEIIIRDDPDAFAEACVRLLNDRDLCARIGEAALHRVHQEYDRAQTVARVRASLARIADGHERPGA
jgi:glycosyltransferase involved in cell wall biosynthesis